MLIRISTTMLTINTSIVVRRKQRKNTFIPNENVILDEYVYYGTKMQNVENPLTQIVNGIIVFLQSGEYKDTTGIAFKNQSVESKDRVPQNISVDNDGNYVSVNGDGADYVSENKQYNKNTNMNKKLIRLTESDLHRIVKNVVNKMINENVSFIDGSGDCKCPYCGKDLYKYIWNPQNIISVSDRYDHYGVDGFQLYRNAYYKCPYCGKGFYVRVRSSDSIFKKFI